MSEPNTPPKLSVVEDLPGSEPGSPRRGIRAVVPWLLLALVLLFAWLWLNQLEGTQRLERQVTGLETELSSARSELAAWESHMGSVRDGIDGVVAQIEALRGLAAGSPGEPTQATAPIEPTDPTEPAEPAVPATTE